MSELETYVPSGRVVKHCEFILVNVDQDIADEYRRYGHGTYKTDSPLLVQISRSLKMLSDSMKNNTGK